MAPKKLKLADQISSLLSGPAPAEAFDPEADDLDQGGWAGRGGSDEGSEDEGGFEEERMPKIAVQAKEKMRLHADIEVDGKQYAGKAVPRKHLKGQDDDDEEGEEEEEEEEEHVRRSVSGSEDEEEQEEEAEPDAGAYEAQRLEDEHDAALVRMVAANKTESAKSMHARNQREMLDTLLETRIRMQKPLQAAARLPRGSVMDTFCSNDKKVCQVVVECCQEAAGLVQDLLELRGLMCKQNSLLPDPNGWEEARVCVSESVQWGKRKRSAERSCEELFERINTAEKQGTPFRNTAIDKWNGKVLMASGGGKSFKALNQSILQQVQHVMQDSTRFMRKSRVKRTVYKIIGAELHNTSSLPCRDSEGANDELDEEAYDDTDLYQLMLRDLIDTGSSQGHNALELQAQLRAARRKAGKASKQVDTKASKGRKLRYDVQTKLVNFMFPVAAPIPAFANPLFENLFKTG